MDALLENPATTGPDEADDERFAVLVVCTGNICRSPLLEQLLRARYGETVARFSSAGTAALVGEGMPEQAVQLSQRLGGSPAGHEPRLLDAALVDRADLVIALAREHRAEIVRLAPRASRRTVTLREAARLLESLESAPDLDLAALHSAPLPDALRALVGLAMGERGIAPPPAAPEDDDVVDPYRQTQDVYDRSGEQVVDALDRIERSLRALASRPV